MTATDPDTAGLAADTAAAAAGVRIREITEPADLGAVPVVFHGVWRPDPQDPPVTPTLLRAMAKAGNYVTGAYDGDGLVGACVGFFGSPLNNELHSHITGVAAGAAGRGVVAVEQVARVLFGGQRRRRSALGMWVSRLTTTSGRRTRGAATSRRACRR